MRVSRPILSLIKLWLINETNYKIFDILFFQLLVLSLKIKCATLALRNIQSLKAICLRRETNEHICRIQELCLDGELADVAEVGINTINFHKHSCYTKNSLIRHLFVSVQLERILLVC